MYGAASVLAGSVFWTVAGGGNMDAFVLEVVEVRVVAVVGRGVEGVSVSVFVEAKPRPVLGRRAAAVEANALLPLLLCEDVPNGEAKSFDEAPPKSLYVNDCGCS